MNEKKKRGPKPGTIKRPWTPETRVCVICETVFNPPRGSPRVTCSRNCRGELMRRTVAATTEKRLALKASLPPPPKRVRRRQTPIVRPCEACGKIFENWTVRRKATCSEACRRELLSRLTKLQYQYVREGKPHQTPELQPVETICEVCGKMFNDRGRNSRKTCSAKCLKKNRLNRLIFYNNTCMVCGKTFTVNNYRRKQKTCSKKCLRKAWARARGVPKPKTIIWRDKTCIICGKVRRLTSTQFYNRGKTCSKECHSKNLQRLSQNFPPLSPEAYRIIGEKTAAHPKTGHLETNINAKEYSLKSPDGEVLQFRNLSLFIDTHRELIASTVGGMENFRFTSARSGLSALAPWRKDKQDSWYGWKWYDGNWSGKGILALAATDEPPT